MTLINGKFGIFHCKVFTIRWGGELEDSIKSKIIKDCFKELLKTIPNMTITSIHTDNGS